MTEVQPSPTGLVQPDGAEGSINGTNRQTSHMVRGSVWVLIGIGIGSASGALFWFLASSVASSASLGRASALYTSIQFVNYASGMGLTVALGRFATDASEESDALFGWAIVYTVVTSIIGGGVYLAVVSSSATDLLRSSVWGYLLFIALTAAASIGLLVDVRMMAARRWGWLVLRISLIGAVRFPLLYLRPSGSTALWLFLVVMVPQGLGGVFGVPLLRWIGAGRARLSRPKTWAVVLRYSTVNWVALVSSQAPQFAVPLIVALSVRASVNANFFLAWTITGVVFLVPYGISQVLLVEGAKTAEKTAAATRRSREALAFSVGLSTVAWLGSLLMSRLVVPFFGEAYSAAAGILPSLMLAGIPWSFAAIRLAEARVHRDQLATVTITCALGLGILVPALVWVPRWGTVGATRAWLAGNILAAAVSLTVRRRTPRSAPATA